MKKLSIAIACLAAGILSTSAVQTFDVTVGEYQYGYEITYATTGIDVPSAHFFLDSFETGSGAYLFSFLPGGDLTPFTELTLGSHTAKVLFAGFELDTPYVIDRLPDQLPDFSHGLSFLGDLISTTTTSAEQPVSSPDCGSTFALLALAAPLIGLLRRRQ